MRRNTLFVVGTLLLDAGALVHCSSDSPDGALAGSDGGADATAVVPNDAAGVDGSTDRFYLELSLAHATEDPGDSVPIAIAVHRDPSFSDVVTFYVTAPPSFTITTPPPAGDSSTFYVTESSDAGTSDSTIIVTGTDGRVVRTAELGVHTGSVYAFDDDGTFVAPSFPTKLTFKVWGAGGGAGAPCADAGASGGAGGFATGNADVTGGERFDLLVGRGGPFSGIANCYLSGGGGGYSSVQRPDGGAVILIAGGGGGGGGSGANTTVSSNGGAGGGETGEPGAGDCAGTGGSASDGGVGGACTTCNGGNGVGSNGGSGCSSQSGTSAHPGGGGYSQNGGGGGGGGGYFGGGGGGQSLFTSPQKAGGGGGGSGYASIAGATLTAGSGTNPAATSDPDYVSGVAKGGQAASGGNGRIVVRLSKP